MIARSKSSQLAGSQEPLEPRASPALRWALSVLLAAFPFAASTDHASDPEAYKTLWVGVGFTLVLVWWQWGGSSSGNRWDVPRLARPLALMTVWVVATGVWATNRHAAVASATPWLFGLIGFVLVFNCFASTVDRRRLLDCMYAGAVAIALLGAAQQLFYVEWVVQGPARPAATFGNKNMLMHYLVLAAPLGLGLLSVASNPLRIWAIALGLAVIYVVFAYTMTRAALLAGTVQLCLWLIWRTWCALRDRPRSADWRRIAAVVVATILFIGAAHLERGALADPLAILGARLDAALVELESQPQSKPAVDAKGTATSTLGSVQIRFLLWRDTLVMISDNPFLGVGIGNWHVQYPRYGNLPTDGTRLYPVVHAHNGWLELVAETGIVGFGLLAWILVVATTSARSAFASNEDERPIVVALCLGLLGIGITAGFSFSLQLTTPLLMIMTYLALLVRLEARTNPSSSGVVVLPGRARFLAVMVAVAFVLAVTVYGFGRNSRIPAPGWSTALCG